MQWMAVHFLGALLARLNLDSKAGFIELQTLTSFQSCIAEPENITASCNLASIIELFCIYVTLRGSV